jgi:hypothetical protein
MSISIAEFSLCLNFHSLSDLPKSRKFILMVRMKFLYPAGSFLGLFLLIVLVLMKGFTIVLALIVIYYTKEESFTL